MAPSGWGCPKPVNRPDSIGKRAAGLDAKEIGHRSCQSASERLEPIDNGSLLIGDDKAATCKARLVRHAAVPDPQLTQPGASRSHRWEC